MRLTYCLIALALTACGKPSPAPVVVDPALAPYMASFETNVGASSAGISAQFANTETQSNPLGETVGECVISTDQNGNVVSKQIQVDQTYWNSSDESQRVQLMYHELGHCALNMEYHITTFQSNGCPTSIMYPYTFGDSPCYLNNESYYYQELSTHI